MNDVPTIFVDSDVFVALTVANDSNHQKAVSLLNQLLETPAKFFTSNYVFSESITVISQRSSHATAVEYIRKMQAQDSPFHMKWVDEVIEEQAIQIFLQQTSKNTSFVDCANIAFVKRLNADAIFSFDEDYRKNGLPSVIEYLAAAPQPQEIQEDEAA